MRVSGVTEIKSRIFTLFYRENCHLCDSMRLALMKLKKRVDFDWKEIDIDRDKRLIRLYDEKVPVLQFNDREVCHFFIDEQAICEILSSQGYQPTA